MTAADDAYRTIRRAGPQDSTPLAGIRAAMTWQHAAARLAAEYTRLARQDGVGWLEIGRALELAGDSDYDVMVTAYERSCGRDGLGHPLPYWFRCGTCGQHVTDRGPYAGNPLDQEEGHAETCARFAAAVAEHRHQWDEEDDDD